METNTKHTVGPRRMFDVHCNDRYVTTLWATSKAEAISVAQEGIGADNAIWKAIDLTPTSQRICPTCNLPPIRDCQFANCKREFAAIAKATAK